MTSPKAGPVKVIRSAMAWVLAMASGQAAKRSAYISRRGQPGIWPAPPGPAGQALQGGVEIDGPQQAVEAVLLGAQEETARGGHQGHVQLARRLRAGDGWAQGARGAWPRPRHPGPVPAGQADPDRK